MPLHEKNESKYFLPSPVKPSGSQNTVDRNLTILIAEDDEDYAFILRNTITLNGWTNPVCILPNGSSIPERRRRVWKSCRVSLSVRDVP